MKLLFRIELPITEKDAEEVAIGYIQSNLRFLPESQRDVKIDTTRSGNFMIFTYQSKRFLSTGNLMDTLLGNAPVVVDMTSGDVLLAPTNEPINLGASA